MVAPNIRFDTRPPLRIAAAPRTASAGAIRIGASGPIGQLASRAILAYARPVTAPGRSIKPSGGATPGFIHFMALDL